MKTEVLIKVVTELGRRAAIEHKAQKKQVTDCFLSFSLSTQVITRALFSEHIGK